MSSPSSLDRDKRIQEEISKLMKDFQVKLTDEDKLDKLEVVFHGPKETLYEGGVWKIIVDIPSRYPLEPPKFTFANKIFHPNINNESGFVCVDLLDENWHPDYSLVAIFDQIIPQLLREPNPKSANNLEAGALLLCQSKEMFEQRVREYCAKYAKMQDIQSESSSGEGSRSNQDQTPGHANP
ncbi:hypothetical protein QN277_025441 [Acacia crassicarpa]|uniref:UBC core domain-containing protein n=1 Tax=Acacia crassicarpa TaxID=499986 RepID=A0AAE1MJL3_9FABA|nr:hypothetical protein QN277_025441 [Acacia crassicarpa]